MLVKGPVTGAEYQFSGNNRLQLVDPRDAVGIARNSLFRIEGVVEIAVANPKFVKQGDGHDA